MANMPMIPSDLALMKERIEVLDGSRRGKNGSAAVRVADLSPGLLGLPDKLKSAKAAGNPVTPAEYDALVEDVQLLYRTLKALAVSIKGRTAP